MAGDITDHRDGTITVKMGRLTALEETLELIYGVMRHDEPAGQRHAASIPHGRIRAAAVRRAVDDGLLTEEECQTILNFDKEDQA